MTTGTIPKYNIPMEKPIKRLTCRACKKNFELKACVGKYPEYCSNECRKPSGPKIWHMVCKGCNKEWSMEKPNGGRKPHYCPDCYEVGKKERHLKRNKDYKKRYRTRKDVDEVMVKWLPAEPLIRYLAAGHVKDEDWAIATSRDRHLVNYMAMRLGLQYTSMTRYMQPGARINAYKADEYAIKLRHTPNAYLGVGVLSLRSS